MFEGTLLELKKGLSKCDITLTNMELALKPNMVLVRQYNSYLKTFFNNLFKKNHAEHHRKTGKNFEAISLTWISSM